MSENLKLCKNCRHFVESYSSLNPQSSHSEYCSHPDNLTIDLVYGNEIRKRTPKELRYELNFNNSCGQNAQWYESKDDAPPF